MSWYTASQVSVNNNSTIVRVGSGESIAAINPHDSLVIGDFTGVDILNTYVEDGTNDEIIELVLPWVEANQINQPAKVIPTAANFNSSVTVMANMNASILNRLNEYILFGEQQSGDVTFTAIGVGNSDVTTHCIAEWDSIFTALAGQGQGAVDDLNAIELAVNGDGGNDTGLIGAVADAEEDLAAIDNTLQGYVTSASNDAGYSLNYRNEAEGFAIAAAASFDNFDDKYLGAKASDPTVDNDGDALIVGQTYWNTGDNGLRYYTGVVWELPDATAAAAASAASADALLAEQYANWPEDSYIPNTTKYSAYHWKKKAELVAGGTAPDSVLFGGELPSYYAESSNMVEYDRNYSVSTSITAPILNRDGSTLSGTNAIRVRGYVSGTGSPDTAACAVFAYYSGAWVVHNTSGEIGFNKVQFVIDNGVPAVKTDHASSYVATIHHEVLSLDVGHVNENYWGVDGVISSLNGELKFKSNKIYNEGFKPTATDVLGINFAVTDVTNAADSDTLTSNQIGYATGGGISNPFDVANDGGLITTHHSDNWQGQIFHDFRTGNIAVRGKANGSWSGWSEVYSSTNKPEISEVNELQAKLDEIELFALAGL